MGIWNTVLELLFPGRKNCLICGRAAESPDCLCRLCQDKITVRRNAFCPACGRYWPETGILQNDREIIEEVCDIKMNRGKNMTLCWDCISSPPPFFTARSLGEYGGVLKDSIYLFKYQRHRSLAVCLGRLMAEFFLQEKALHGTYVLVPVPLSNEKLRERGFNQCELLALETGRRLGIPVRNCLQKVKNTPSQSKLTRGSRIDSVKGAFQLSGNLSGEQVLLIDDIFTTGATVGECAQVLLEGGAGKVGVLTLASGVLKKVEDSTANAGKCRHLSNLP